MTGHVIAPSCLRLAMIWRAGRRAPYSIWALGLPGCSGDRAGGKSLRNQYRGCQRKYERGSVMASI